VQVTVAKLRAMANRLLAHLEETGHSVIEIDEDYYWDVPAARRYNPYEKPEALTLGQLSDQWSDLEKILADEKGVLNYDLVWFAAILRSVGEAAGEVATGGERQEG
jgi:hypothetical protein